MNKICTLCAALLVAPTAAAAFVPGHVYVAVEGFDVNGSAGFIVRYPLHGNRVSEKPDRVYVGYAGPLAFDAEGSLYAGRGFLGESSTAISVFRNDSPSPSYTYAIPGDTYAAWVSAMAVDPHGFLTFAYVTQAGSSYGYQDGIATYRLADYQLVNNMRFGGVPDVPQPIGGITFDSTNHVYLTYGNILVFDGVDTPKLRQVRTIEGSGFADGGAGGIVISPAGELYADDLGPTKTSISSYPDSAHGIVAADRTLVPAGPDAWEVIMASGDRLPLPYQIGVHNEQLFVPFYERKGAGGRTGLYVFNKFQNGTAHPEQAFTITTTPSGYPFVAESAIVGP
jgi:hypothetical protein